MRRIRKLLGWIHSTLLQLYDRVSSKKCAVSVGDIILKRAELDHCQFLLTTRKLDVAAFVSGVDQTFPYQNTVSRAVYGSAHKEERGNRHFTDLIKSYQTKGYDPTSLLTVDKECRLIDGNHRMGLNLYMEIEQLNVKYLRRSSKFSRNLDKFLKLCVSSNFMVEVYTEFSKIQEWLIETGNTFCCLLKGEYEKDEVSLVKDLRLLVNVLKTYPLSTVNSSQGILVQFAIDFPSYCIKEGVIYSKRAAEIEKILNLRKKNSNWIVP